MRELYKWEVSAIFFVSLLFCGCQVDLAAAPDLSDPRFNRGDECKLTSDCELGRICMNGYCVQGCNKTSDCPDDEECIEHRCKPVDNGGDEDSGKDAGKDGGKDAEITDADGGGGKDDILDAGDADVEVSDTDGGSTDAVDADANDDVGIPDDGSEPDVEIKDDGGEDTSGDIGEVKCTSILDCPLGWYCGSEGICAQDCKSPIDCKSNETCTSSGKCVMMGQIDAGVDGGTDGGIDAGADGGVDGGGDAGPGAFDLTGYFGMKVEIHSNVTANWVNAKNVVSYQYLLIQFLVHSGTYVESISKYCKIELPKVDDSETTIRQEAIDNIPPAHESGNYLSDTYPGAYYSPPQRAEVMGAELADPFVDPLPLRAGGLFQNECPSNTSAVSVKFRSRSANICYSDKLRDTDADSVPAITVHITNVPFPVSGDTDGFIALKNILQIGGVVEDSNTAQGLVEPNIEQETLAIDHWLTDVGSVTPTVEIRRGESKFEMKRIDGKYQSPNLDSNGDGVINCKEFFDQKATVGF